MKTHLWLAGLLLIGFGFDASSKDKTDSPRHEEKGKKKGSKGGEEYKVTVNHKGKLIAVDQHALKAHLAHGDSIVSGNSPGISERHKSKGTKSSPEKPKQTEEKIKKQKDKAPKSENQDKKKKSLDGDRKGDKRK